MKKDKRIIMVSLMLAGSLSIMGCKGSDYKKGVEYQETGKYKEAVEMYKSIKNYGDYKDTADRIKSCEAMIDAIAQYDASKSALIEKNKKIDSGIQEAENLLNEKKNALEESLVPALETAISNTKEAKQEIPEMPTDVNDILSVTETMESTNYDSVIADLNNAKEALEKSIKQYELVDNPSEAYVIKCLKKIDHIKDISAVTEDNDPNGNLNKPGGYTATVYYSDDRIDLDENIYGNTVIDQGTMGGGGIEVYSTVEDAEKREEYLATYDGGIFASGTHTVVGTVVVRTSNELKASQQKEMEDKIIETLTHIE